jgi:hypothetical protein
MTVHYATEYGSADALIELLISKHSSPRRLTVVSSDHRLHRAARRRRATAVDSDIWYAALVERRRERNLPSPAPTAKPEVPLSPDQVEYWLNAFGTNTAALLDSSTDGMPTRRKPAADDPSHAEPSENGVADDTPAGDAKRELPPFNPFPPGYAEDVEHD